MDGLFFKGEEFQRRRKFRQNFLAKSYEPKKQGVKGFLGNKCLYFQSLTQPINIVSKCSNLRQAEVKSVLSRYV
jgi:hypothetical protein